MGEGEVVDWVLAPHELFRTQSPPLLHYALIDYGLGIVLIIDIIIHCRTWSYSTTETSD